MRPFTKSALTLGAAVVLSGSLASCQSLNNMIHGRSPCAATANPCAPKNPCKPKNPCAANLR